MTSAVRVSESVRTTATEASTAAEAWRATADAATRTVDAIKTLQGEGGAGRRGCRWRR